MLIKKGDNVLILSGKDKGKKGKIEQVFSKESKVLVSGVNIVKKHAKGKGIVDKVLPLDVSNVALVCPKCNLPTRIGHRLNGKEKVRICKKCQEVLSNE